ncbi:hypothetical protein GCM10009847_02680 [Leucobacter tardus]
MLVGMLAVMLTACAPEPSEDANPTPTPSEFATSTPTPTPTPTPEPSEDEEVSLPTCDEYLGSPLMQGELIGAPLQVSKDSDEVLPWMDRLGPAALTTFDAAETRRACDWVAGQNGASGMFAVLDDDQRDTMIRALEESDYVVSEGDDATSFVYPADSSRAQIWQGFIGDAWVVATDASLGRDLAATLTELRPELVD